jgi:hypothetical protein
MALLIVAISTSFLLGHSKAALSLAAHGSSTALPGTGRILDYKLLARTTICVEGVITLALLALSANNVDIVGALTSGLVVAFILHLWILGARRR